MHFISDIRHEVLFVARLRRKKKNKVIKVMIESEELQ